MSRLFLLGFLLSFLVKESVGFNPLVLGVLTVYLLIGLALARKLDIVFGLVGMLFVTGFFSLFYRSIALGVKEEVNIINELGMHARAAGAFVKMSEKFKSDIKVSKDGMDVNGKSIMGLMMLAASKGSTITLKISGEDEQDAFNALKGLIDNKFGEER